jgi:hypothetical protein
MKLIRLEFAQHPRPPQRELRQRGVFDSGGSLLGYVANVYVDEERNYRFVDIAVGGFMGLSAKHHLVPVEAIAEGEPGSVTLTVDQQTIESAPTWATCTKRRMRICSVPPASTANSGRCAWE